VRLILRTIFRRYYSFCAKNLKSGNTFTYIKMPKREEELIKEPPRGTNIIYILVHTYSKLTSWCQNVGEIDHERTIYKKQISFQKI
jgi:hypothetical protein